MFSHFFFCSSICQAFTGTRITDQSENRLRAIHPIEFNQKSSRRGRFRLIDSKYLYATQPEPNWVRATHVRWKINLSIAYDLVFSLALSIARSLCLHFALGHTATKYQHHLKQTNTINKRADSLVVFATTNNHKSSIIYLTTTKKQCWFVFYKIFIEYMREKVYGVGSMNVHQ